MKKDEKRRGKKLCPKAQERGFSGAESVISSVSIG
jgi:hypothetical protein